MSEHLRKLPAITASFWVMKICATTLGETGGDLFSMTLKIGYAVSSLILLGFFLVTLFAQLAAKSFHPVLYWTVILSTSTAGTTMSDYLDRTAGLGYFRGCLLLLTLLLSVLVFWRWKFGTLSVENVRTFPVELTYWTAILISNTLGTALGDFLAHDSKLGFGGGALLIAGVLALILFASHFTLVSKVALFWAAFVLTRPFGATLGDILTKPHQEGGLNFGTLGSSAVLLSILMVAVGCVSGRTKESPTSSAN